MKILIAFDGSAGAVAASEFIKKIMKEGDEVIGLFVLTDTEAPLKMNMFEGTRSFDTIENLIYYLRDLFKAIMSEKNVKFAYKIEEKNNIPKMILDFAKENNIELIVTGTRKLKGLEKLIVGSVSQALVSESNVPVLVVPP